VPIKKLGNGYYIFGTRKIYAKILNGKLVIRVGGGFMIIEEFINNYAEQELNKINKLNEQQRLLNGGQDDDVDSLDIPPASRHAASSKYRGSGRLSHKSPRPAGQNGNGMGSSSMS
jgi:Growth-Arrest-Specific Protein 2 Domain